MEMSAKKIEMVRAGGENSRLRPEDIRMTPGGWGIPIGEEWYPAICEPDQNTSAFRINAKTDEDKDDRGMGRRAGL